MRAPKPADSAVGASGNGISLPLSDPVAVESGNGGWVVAARIVSQAAQFLIILVAARAMSPPEFGAFALLSASAIGLTRFSEAGWREYVMTTDSDDASAQANLLALFCGAASMAIGLLASLGLVVMPGETAGAGVFAMMAVWVLLTTLSATQAGMLIKRGRLRALSVAMIVGEMAGFVAALIVFALDGGIFGLAAAKLGMQIGVLGLSLNATRWCPIPTLNKTIAQEAFLFSRRILATRLISYMQDNVSIFAIGALVGPAGAGLFRAATRLGGALLDVIAEPMRVLAWSTLRTSNPGPAANRLFRLAAIVATPFFVGLAVTADQAVNLLLGPEWAESAPLLVAISLAGWLNMFNILTEPLLVLSGRIQIVPRLSLAFTVIHLLVLVAAAPFGIYWVAIGQFVATACTLPLVLFMQQRYGGLSLAKLALHVLPAILGAAALALAVWTIRVSLPLAAAEWTKMLAEAGAGAIVYFVVVAVLVPRHAWKLRGRSFIAQMTSFVSALQTWCHWWSLVATI